MYASTMTQIYEDKNQSLRPLGGSWTTERWIGFFLVLGGYCFYFPFNVLASSMTPVDVSMALDQMIPLTPWWIVIYAMIYPAAFLPLVVVRDPFLFRKLVLGYLCLEASAMFLFVLAPVHMTLRPEISAVTGEDFFSWGVQFCYWVDKPACCFPSLHVAAATYSALCALRVDRVVGWCAVVVAVGISLSTLLVKQHFVADVILGASLATFWYLIWMAKAQPLDGENMAYPRTRALIPVGIFTVVILGFLTAYLLEWSPWLVKG